MQNPKLQFNSTPHPIFVQGETSTADKIKEVNILDFFKALYRSESSFPAHSVP